MVAPDVGVRASVCPEDPSCIVQLETCEWQPRGVVTEVMMCGAFGVSAGWELVAKAPDMPERFPCLCGVIENREVSMSMCIDSCQQKLLRDKLPLLNRHSWYMFNLMKRHLLDCTSTTYVRVHGRSPVHVHMYV